ncbi:MAG: AbrB/MazE/SpoVT family DNA-binding domain-containing protein [Desulfobacteraceae bacterium]|nr:AbrB/MazE/SpoVT family DNA-binding domain-containing protein [Desulfobacteraceae bacterium]
MKVTIKGQVTIPQDVREKLKITPATEIDFLEEKGRFYIVKRAGEPNKTGKFHKLRGIANVKMRTDEIMALTRGKK